MSSNDNYNNRGEDIITVTKEEFDAFCEMLDAPPKASSNNRKLERLLDHKPIWEE